MLCDATYHDLFSHPDVRDVEGLYDTAIFLRKANAWCEILNIKILGADFMHNYRMEGVLRDQDNFRLQTILQFRNTILIIAGTKSKRVKQLSKGTAVSIHPICYGVVELSRHLVATSHRCVNI